MKTKSNKNQNSKAQSRPEQLGNTTELFQIDLAARQYNRGLPLERVISLIQTKTPHFWDMVEVVGKWLWIRFDGKQTREVTAELSELGFHWNNRRQVWQHPCGQPLNRTNFDPRQKYGSYFVADQKAA